MPVQNKVWNLIEYTSYIYIYIYIYKQNSLKDEKHFLPYLVYIPVYICVCICACKTVIDKYVEWNKQMDWYSERCGKLGSKQFWL